jgi:ribosomal protein S18 acetylase RimI-like enzyme
MMLANRPPLTLEQIWERTAESEVLISRLMGSQIVETEYAIFASNRQNQYTMANRVHRIRASVDTIEAVIDRGLDFFRAANTIPHFQVTSLSRPPDLSVRLLQRGLRRMAGSITVLAHDLAAGPLVEAEVYYAHRLHNLSIETIAPADLMRWADTFKSGFETELTDDMFVTWSRCMSSGTATFYLATAGTELAGTAILFRDRGTGAISTVSTLPQWRHRGVASALIHRCSADSVAHGDDLLTISADSETPAERLYRQLGFTAAYRATSYMR